MIEEFKFNKYGTDFIFKTGEEVTATYYHEHDGGTLDCYKRPFCQWIESEFTPVKHGIIIGNAGTHPFWLGRNREEQYLFVKFKEYRFNKAIPISCLQNRQQRKKEILAFLEREKHRIGNPGYSFDSYNQLKNSI